MNRHRTARVRRREHAAAVACAVSLFIALVAGSALRPHYTTNALPEPGVAHAVEHAQHDVAHVRPISAVPSLSVPKDAGNSRRVPVVRKPFRYVWMTHDIPSSWIPISPQMDWSALPKSFVTTNYESRGAPRADAGNRHTSSLFDIIRC